eukprot:NODE_1881_length_1370_cov_32.289175_g1702_i0.p1 GENE.NODE_1881_length_1370_cov_32.289175_g1702_i0~~NODE_1881_length_1370_cov_32.289175_g1702_i0.p1  ORF type:complete len:352 (-),score=53.96 NODE_1881_length_1370_cov_32.289175_g1702_i0:223-1278(-)
MVPGSSALGLKSTTAPIRTPVLIWGMIDISALPRYLQFLIASLGVFAFFIIFGIQQEAVTSAFTAHDTHLGLFMSVLMFAIYILVSSAELTFASKQRIRLPPRPACVLYMLLGGCSVLSSGFSNVSCEYLNYPSQVMYKSCKLLLVMVVGIFMLRKRYQWYSYCAAVSLTTGLVLLSVADSESALNHDVLGVVFISGSLFGDAFISNLQEMIYRDFSPSEGEVILFQRSCGISILLVLSVATGQLKEGVAFVFDHPSVLGRIVMFGLAGVSGEYFIMLLTRLFGALSCVLTTSIRKAMTIYLSFLLFPKPYNHLYLVASICIFAGIGLNTWGKNRQQLSDFWRRLRKSSVE